MSWAVSRRPNGCRWMKFWTAPARQVECWLNAGIMKAMNEFNGAAAAPPEKGKSETLRRFVYFKHGRQGRAIKDTIDKISAEIAAAGGKVETVQKMDKKTFARVADRKYSTGFYVNFVFEGAPAIVAQLRHRFATNEDDVPRPCSPWRRPPSPGRPPKCWRCYGQLQQSHPGGQPDARSRIALHAQGNGGGQDRPRCQPHLEERIRRDQGGSRLYRRRGLGPPSRSHRPIHAQRPPCSSKAASNSIPGKTRTPTRNRANSKSSSNPSPSLIPIGPKARLPPLVRPRAVPPRPRRRRPSRRSRAKAMRPPPKKTTFHFNPTNFYPLTLYGKN
jgi:ribosomal protein S6